MGFTLDISVDKSLWDAALGTIREKSPKGVMWSMREAGRAIKARGQGAAPVYTGRLMASISTSRNISGGSDEFKMSVGPYGPEVALYSGKMQALYGYMDSGPGEGTASSAANTAFNSILGPYA